MAKTNRYSLADYTITVQFPSEADDKAGIFTASGLDNDSRSFIIGGPGSLPGSRFANSGSFVGNIRVTRNSNLFTTEGDATGSWVHNKNLDRTGTVEVDITQISDQIITLAYICKAYESVQDDTPGLTLSIKNAFTGEEIVTCNDCYIQKITDQIFGDTAERQNWVFTCGQVLYF